MSDPHQPWEPDPRKMGNWTDMFSQSRGSSPAPSPTPSPSPALVGDPFDDAELPSIDLAEYRPWILQRGRSRAAMMLALRWFDAKAGLWHGTAVAYPALYAMDTMSDRLINLDFGARQFVLEGHGLDVLARYLLQGSVLKIVVYAPAIWPDAPQGPVVTGIRRVTGDGDAPPR